MIRQSATNITVCGFFNCAQHGRNLTGASPERTLVVKCIANGKGVLGGEEFEGRRMANLWSDEQKSHIRHGISGKVAKQTEALLLSEGILCKCGR